MVKLFDNEKKRLASERQEDEDEPGGGGGEYEESSPVTFDAAKLRDNAERYENIAIPTPSDLKPEGQRQRQAERAERTAGLQESILGSLGVDLASISQNISDAGDIEFEGATQAQILGAIANILIDQNQLMEVLVTTNVSQLQAQLDIADAVEPARGVAVSGVNAIDNANTPQPVIPNADTTDIPTKTLFVRASPDNDSPLFIGDDQINPEEGYILNRGEAIEVELNFVGDALWMASETEGDEVQLMGLI